ncbi:uncharacterized protein BJ212DRAFT_1359717 [Suillus subaureus]|uniref:Ricin B lectin domain-containing protein n=1 Tax=Suillus subaureus TaxID=48587 RepID=A0A9P7E9K4_9AGAM|nr:uncharacterized protein BJ212DRAFT_1359717 [Suillus subaureus]KAG1815134.1 hypothetical protein BJ212DRAFT_1359717 [Suillus subaureus]
MSSLSVLALTPFLSSISSESPPLHCATAMQPGIYKFINRQSGTAMDLAKNDNTSVVGSPPCDNDSTQKWEIAPLGAGHTIRNMRTGAHLSVKGLHRNAAIFAGSFPVAWELRTVKVDHENAEMIEIRWPHTQHTFDLAGYGSSAPGTKVQLMDTHISPIDYRCRLWKPIFIQHILHSVLLERVGEDDETSSTTTINAADVPEGGELVLVTTTTSTTRTVVTKIPK